IRSLHCIPLFSAISKRCTDFRVSGARKGPAALIFQPARRGFILRQPGCIGCEVSTAKSLCDSWTGGLVVACRAGASCHPAVSHPPVSQGGDTNDVTSTAGGGSFQCDEASSVHIDCQAHPDKYEDSYASAYDTKSTFASGGHCGRTSWGSSW